MLVDYKNAKFRRGEIVEIDFGAPIGSEQGGIRTAIIISNDMGNEYGPTIIVVATTTKTKTRIPTHVKSQTLGNTTVLCEQIRTFDKSRVTKKNKNRVLPEEMRQIERALRISIGL